MRPALILCVALSCPTLAAAQHDDGPESSESRGSPEHDEPGPRAELNAANDNDNESDETQSDETQGESHDDEASTEREVQAQQVDAEQPSENQDELFTPAEAAAASSSTVALARSLDERLTVWRTSRRRVHVLHCRRARSGCRARIVALARLIVAAGQTHNVDPFLLAAMALRESGLNPFAEGGIGERGIVQLHPRGVGARVRFVQNEGYRQRCARDASACQEEVLDVGARLVADSVESCGTILDALGMYNSGACHTTPYGEGVMQERLRLLRLAKLGRERSEMVD